MRDQVERAMVDRIQSIDWKGRKVFITTMCRDGMVESNHNNSILSVLPVLVQLGINPIYSKLEQESLVTRGRNLLVAMARTQDFGDGPTGCDELIMWDSDIGLPDPMHLVALLAAPFDVVGGVYAIKRLHFEAIGKAYADGYRGDERLTSMAVDTCPKVFAGTETQMTTDGCVEVGEIGTGLLRISRKAIEAICAHFSDLNHTNDGPGLLSVPGVFLEMLREEPLPTSKQVIKRHLSEDYAFCRRWQEMGNKVYAHLGVRTTHMGKFLYQFDPLTRIRA